MSIPMMASTSAKNAYLGGPTLPTQRIYPPLGLATVGVIVPVLENDDVQMIPNGWMVLPSFGATSARPAFGSYALTPGRLFVDTTVSKTVIFDGLNWRDVTTGNIA